MISVGFPSRFLKCSYHFWNLSFWLAAFSFVLGVLFLPPTSLTVCHANRDCMFSKEFLILLIWSWMHSSYSFFPSLLSFSALAFIGFPLLPKDAFFMLLTPNKLHIWPLVWLILTQMLFLCWRWQSFHTRHSEYVYQISPEEYRIWFLVFTVTVYLLLISLLASEELSYHLYTFSWYWKHYFVSLEIIKSWYLV